MESSPTQRALGGGGNYWTFTSSKRKSKLVCLVWKAELLHLQKVVKTAEKNSSSAISPGQEGALKSQLHPPPSTGFFMPLGQKVHIVKRKTSRQRNCFYHETIKRADFTKGPLTQTPPVLINILTM